MTTGSRDRYSLPTTHTPEKEIGCLEVLQRRARPRGDPHQPVVTIRDRGSLYRCPTDPCFW